MSAIYQVLQTNHPKPNLVNTIRVTTFKVLLSFFRPSACEGCIPVVPCHIVIYPELNPNILSEFSIFSSLMSNTHFPTSASGYFHPLIYVIMSRWVCLIFHADILTLLASPSIPWITFINALNYLTTVIALLLLFAMDRVTMHCLRVRVLSSRQPVISDLFETLSGEMCWGILWNKLRGRSTTASLTSIFLWSNDFRLVR